MKVSMSLTVAEHEAGLCYNSRIRYIEKAEVTKTKVISCPDIDDYRTPNESTEVVWYKVNTKMYISLIEMDYQREVHFITTETTWKTAMTASGET